MRRKFQFIDKDRNEIKDNLYKVKFDKKGYCCDQGYGKIKKYDSRECDGTGLKGRKNKCVNK